MEFKVSAHFFLLIKSSIFFLFYLEPRERIRTAAGLIII